MIRTTLTEVARSVYLLISRATAREFDDNHLMQQVKTADVMFSESPTDFEIFHPVGMRVVPLKQDSNQQQAQTPQQGSDEFGDYNYNQPKEPAAELIMVYPGANRSHPVAIAVGDRRVEPYGLKEGQSAIYSPDGNGNMVLFKDDGMYMVANDGEDYKGNTKKRSMSLRHVVKQKQPREIQSGQQDKDWKHEGETVNTEVLASEKKIQFKDGGKVVGEYDKEKKMWNFSSDTDAVFGVDGRYIRIHGGKVYLGVSSKDGIADAKVMTDQGPSDIVFAKVSD